MTAKAGTPSAATRLVEMALEDFELRLATDGTVFAVPTDGAPLTYPLRGGKVSLRAALARRYFAATGGAASQQALADALLVLEGHGQERDPEPVELRVAERDGVHWLDLGTPTGEAVRLTAGGWEVTGWGVPMFRRTTLTGPLPKPSPGGDLNTLWSLVNVDPKDRPLLLAWLVAALLPAVPHPIVALLGEQGTGKTTAGKVLSLLVDPSPAPARKAPRDSDAWVTAASGSWVVTLDNLSTVPDWLSDTLCRAVTGDGDVRRQLYTDGQLVVFAFRRCIVVTGIDLGAVRGDLADRLLPIDLRLISDDDRLEEQEFWPQWQELHPQLLGGLLDLTASVLAVLPSVELATKPRMADYARVLAAVDQVLGTSGLIRYADRAGSLAVDSLTGDPFVTAMGEVLTEVFEGTSAELLTAVTPTVIPGEDAWRAPKGWPASARQVTTVLKRQAPVMRRAGWIAEELPPGHDNALRWRIARPEKARNTDSQHSQHSPDRRAASVASVASDGYGPSKDVPAGSCTVCGTSLDQAAAAGGFTTHLGCDLDQP